MSDTNKDERLDAEVLVRMPASMKTELEDRAAKFGEEGSSVSRLVRQAIREYFRRHPQRST